MSSQPATERAGLAYVIGILGSLLIVAALVWAMQRYTQPPPLGQDRVAVRKKALADLRAAIGRTRQPPARTSLPVFKRPHLSRLRLRRNPASSSEPPLVA